MRLLNQKLNRVTDTCIPEEEAFRKIQHNVERFWKVAESNGKRFLPHEYMYQMLLDGCLKEHYQIDPADSWLHAAAEKNLPMVVPGWEDSTLGNIFASNCIIGELIPSTVKSGIEYMTYLADWYIDTSKNIVLSYLHKAIKPVNQLRMIEDSVVIYRISRAPERRIFYIDVGNLPKIKAEQYLKDVMNRYRNKLVYDSSSGEIRDDRNHMSMLEDFWLPRREGGRGTEITTLQGGQNLGEIEDIKYFQNKLYRSLNVPISRMEAESGFSLGRSTEITRDELKFTKFVQRLRKRFTPLFTDMLKAQLILKGIVTLEDWNKMKEHIQYNFLQDGHFAELKKAELMQDRLNALQTIETYQKPPVNSALFNAATVSPPPTTEVTIFAFVNIAIVLPITFVELSKGGIS